jgi:hypothetical protein
MRVVSVSEASEFMLPYSIKCKYEVLHG